MAGAVHSIQERRVFIDTAAFAAFADKDDHDHQAASTIFDRLADQHYSVFTTNAVVFESHALLLRLGAGPARDFLTRIEESRIAVVRVKPADERQAKEIIFGLLLRRWAEARQR